MHRWLCIVRIDHKQLCPSLFEIGEPVAQLRELSMANRSRVAVDEHQNHRLFASEAAELHLLPGKGFQFEVGS